MSMAPAKRDDDDPEFWGDYHALACEEVERIRRLVGTMRQLGRGDGKRAGCEDVDLEKLAGQVMTLVQREAGKKNVEILLEVEGGLDPLVAVRDQIHQLVMNLVLNSICAAPENGEVSLRVLRGINSKTVVIEVDDNGDGISEEDLERIFDPFFTTKGPDKGTGLGLMICHRIVSDHGGTIEVDSRDGGGSTFRIQLPYGIER
jgi:signal transduction histidine kinase